MPDSKGQITKAEAQELMPLWDGRALDVLVSILRHDVNARLLPTLRKGGKENHDKNVGTIDGMELAISRLDKLRELAEDALKIKEV